MACNVVKRLAESNLLRVRNLDGFTTSIIRRIEREGIDTVPADLSQLSSAVEGAIRKLADDALVNADDFAHPMVVSGLNSLADRDAIDVRFAQPTFLTCSALNSDFSAFDPARSGSEKTYMPMSYFGEQRISTICVSSSPSLKQMIAARTPFYG